MSRSFMGVDGRFSFITQPNFGNGGIVDLNISPSLTSPLEFSGTDHDHRINYNAYGTSIPSNLDYGNIDPPVVRYIRSDDFFVGGAGPSTYFACGDANCSVNNWETIRSHIPMVSAWDPLSGNTVYITVNTDRVDTEHGEITVHSGHLFDQILTQGSRLSDNKATPNSSFPPFSYTLKTDVAPAVTCVMGDIPWAVGPEDYNCLLAWVDRGVPESKILYTHFRIDAAGQVDWESRTNAIVRAPGNADVATVSGISAAFFDNTIFIAFKSNDADPDVRYVSRQVSIGSSWSLPQFVASTKVVDPPTWVYVPDANRESALIWTEAD